MLGGAPPKSRSSFAYTSDLISCAAFDLVVPLLPALKVLSSFLQVSHPTILVAQDCSFPIGSHNACLGGECSMMQAVPLQFPSPELFSGDRHQLPLFLFQVKLRLTYDAMLEDISEEEKVFVAIGYLRGRAFASFARHLGDFLSNEEGHRQKDTDEMFGNFQVFEDRLRLLFGTPDDNEWKQEEQKRPSFRGHTHVQRYS